MSAWLTKLASLARSTGVQSAPDPTVYNLAEVDRIAQELPDADGVRWACECADLVKDKLPPHEQQAVAAASAWAESPNAAAKQAAADAAAGAGPAGPGSWAAQAAAWSNADPPPHEDPAADAAAEAAQQITREQAAKVSDAAAGSVKMSAGVYSDQVELPAQLPRSPLDGQFRFDATDYKTDLTTAPGITHETPPPPTANELQQIANALQPCIDIGYQILRAQGVI